jgi:hypothetical protein
LGVVAISALVNSSVSLDVSVSGGDTELEDISVDVVEGKVDGTKMCDREVVVVDGCEADVIDWQLVTGTK